MSALDGKVATRVVIADLCGAEEAAGALPDGVGLGGQTFH